MSHLLCSRKQSQLFRSIVWRERVLWAPALEPGPGAGQSFPLCLDGAEDESRAGGGNQFTVLFGNTGP